MSKSLYYEEYIELENEPIFEFNTPWEYRIFEKFIKLYQPEIINNIYCIAEYKKIPIQPITKVVNWDNERISYFINKAYSNYYDLKNRTNNSEHNSNLYGLLLLNVYNLTILTYIQNAKYNLVKKGYDDNLIELYKKTIQEKDISNGIKSIKDRIYRKSYISTYERLSELHNKNHRIRNHSNKHLTKENEISIKKFIISDNFNKDKIKRKTLYHRIIDIIQPKEEFIEAIKKLPLKEQFLTLLRYDEERIKISEINFEEVIKNIIATYKNSKSIKDKIIINNNYQNNYFSYSDNNNNKGLNNKKIPLTDIKTHIKNLYTTDSLMEINNANTIHNTASKDENPPNRPQIQTENNSKDINMNYSKESIVHEVERIKLDNTINKDEFTTPKEDLNITQSKSININKVPNNLINLNMIMKVEKPNTSVSQKTDIDVNLSNNINVPTNTTNTNNCQNYNIHLAKINQLPINSTGNTLPTNDYKNFNNNDININPFIYKDNNTYKSSTPVYNSNNLKVSNYNVNINSTQYKDTTNYNNLNTSQDQKYKLNNLNKCENVNNNNSSINKDILSNNIKPRLELNRNVQDNNNIQIQEQSNKTKSIITDESKDEANLFHKLNYKIENSINSEFSFKPSTDLPNHINNNNNIKENDKESFNNSYMSFNTTDFNKNPNNNNNPNIKDNKKKSIFEGLIKPKEKPAFSIGINYASSNLLSNNSFNINKYTNFLNNIHQNYLDKAKQISKGEVKYIFGYANNISNEKNESKNILTLFDANPLGTIPKNLKGIIKNPESYENKNSIIKFGLNNMKVDNNPDSNKIFTLFLANPFNKNPFEKMQNKNINQNSRIYKNNKNFEYNINLNHKDTYNSVNNASKINMNDFLVPVITNKIIIDAYKGNIENCKNNIDQNHNNVNKNLSKGKLNNHNKRNNIVIEGLSELHEELENKKEPNPYDELIKEYDKNNKNKKKNKAKKSKKNNSKKTIIDNAYEEEVNSNYNELLSKKNYIYNTNGMSTTICKKRTIELIEDFNFEELSKSKAKERITKFTNVPENERWLIFGGVLYVHDGTCLAPVKKTNIKFFDIFNHNIPRRNFFSEIKTEKEASIENLTDPDNNLNADKILQITDSMLLGSDLLCLIKKLNIVELLNNQGNINFEFREYIEAFIENVQFFQKIFVSNSRLKVKRMLDDPDLDITEKYYISPSNDNQFVSIRQFFRLELLFDNTVIKKYEKENIINFSSIYIDKLLMCIGYIYMFREEHKKSMPWRKVPGIFCTMCGTVQSRSNVDHHYIDVFHDTSLSNTRNFDNDTGALLNLLPASLNLFSLALKFMLKVVYGFFKFMSCDEFKKYFCNMIKNLNINNCICLKYLIDVIELGYSEMNANLDNIGEFGIGKSFLISFIELIISNKDILGKRLTLLKATQKTFSKKKTKNNLSLLNIDNDSNKNDWNALPNNNNENNNPNLLDYDISIDNVSNNTNINNINDNND